MVETLLGNLKGPKGEKGEKGETGERGPQGETGATGATGEKGDPFTVKKTYESISEMNADFGGSDTDEGDFVMIVSNVEDEDNSKLYVKGPDSFTFVTDLSGAKGMKGDIGPKGDTGATGATGPAGENGVDGEDGNGISSVVKISTEGLIDNYKINFTDGSSTNFTVTNGATGETGATGPQGPQGEAGEDGATPTFRLDSDGNLYVSY